MSILLNRETRVLVQGITGRIGRVQAKWMLDYGTNIVAGVTPSRTGLLSRSGTLSYESSIDRAAAGLGQSTVVGVEVAKYPVEVVELVQRHLMLS